MTFMAKGNNLNPILSGVQYETLMEGNDVITLTIYDGVGNDCISNSEHARRARMDEKYQHIEYLNQNECFVVSNQFSINAKKYRDESNARKLPIIVPFHLWVALSGVIILLIFLALKYNLHLLPGFIKKNFFERIKSLNSNMKQCYDRLNHEEETIEFQSENYDKDSHYNDDNEVGREEETVWNEYLDEISGDRYYENRRTRRVTWTKPKDCLIITESHQEQNSREEIKDVSSQSENTINNEERPNWVQYLDETTGDHYYKNVQTRRVTWTKPNENVFVVD